MKYCLFPSFHSAISIAPLQVLYYSAALPTKTDTVSEFHVEAHRHATAGKGLAHGL